MQMWRYQQYALTKQAKQQTLLLSTPLPIRCVAISWRITTDLHGSDHQRLQFERRDDLCMPGGLYQGRLGYRRQWPALVIDS